MAKSVRQNKEIAALYQINQFLGYVDKLDVLLHSIMEVASKTVAAEASSIALYDNQKKDLYFTVSLGKMSTKVKEFRIELGQGIIGFAAQSKKPLNIRNVSKDKRFHGDVDKKTKFKTRSILAVPILRQKKLIGALEVINKKTSPSFSLEDTKLLEIVAGQAAIAIENAKLYQRIIQKHAALEEKHRRMTAMQQQMLRMERMSAVGNMASAMVHDLRNPLTVIRGTAELFKYSSDDKERAEQSSVIVDEVDRLNGMTSEVMDFIKGKTTLQFSEYNVNDFVKEIASYLRRDFQPHNIELVVEANYQGPVYMDKSKMQRAIFNISFNARDAMPNGGKFKLTTNSLEGNILEIRLSDTGPGIPAEIKDKLCQPFATFGKAHGTGLGLAIVRKVVQEHHKGNLSIESAPGQIGNFNTSFIIRIPINQTPGSPQDPAPQQGTS